MRRAEGKCRQEEEELFFSAFISSQTVIMAMDPDSILLLGYCLFRCSWVCAYFGLIYMIHPFLTLKWILQAK